MMPAWVTTSNHPPPPDRVIMVRTGANVFDAAFSKWRGWVACYPGQQSETRIEPPEFWFDAQATEDTPELSAPKGQLSLDLFGDSKSLSERAA